MQLSVIVWLWYTPTGEIGGLGKYNMSDDGIKAGSLIIPWLCGFWREMT